MPSETLVSFPTHPFAINAVYIHVDNALPTYFSHTAHQQTLLAASHVAFQQLRHQGSSGGRLQPTLPSPPGVSSKVRLRE